MFHFLDRIASALLAMLGIILVAMVMINVWNVASRHLLGESLLWADEVSTYMLIVMTYLGAVLCAGRGTELRMDVFVARLPRKVQTIIGIFQQVVICVLTGWVGWLSCGYAERLYNMGFKSTAAQVPLWLINAVLPISLLLISLIALTRFFQYILGAYNASRSTTITAEPASK